MRTPKTNKTINTRKIQKHCFNSKTMLTRIPSSVGNNTWSITQEKHSPVK